MTFHQESEELEGLLISWNKRVNLIRSQFYYANYFDLKRFHILKTILISEERDLLFGSGQDNATATASAAIASKDKNVNRKVSDLSRALQDIICFVNPDEAHKKVRYACLISFD